jgi:hypothetical protein
LALWFVGADRYERIGGMPFRSVRERCRQLGFEKQDTPADDHVLSSAD